MSRIRRLAVVLVVFAFLAGSALLFQTREMVVDGSSYYGQSTIASWISKEQLSVNTLYILCRYRFTKPPLPSGIKRLSVSLVNPWTVRVTVHDKKRIGYMDYDGSYIYFGESGTALFKTKKVLEDTPYVTGIEFDEGEMKVGEVLPAKNKSVFTKLELIESLFQEKEIPVDQITVQSDQMTVLSGQVRIRLGSDGYEEKAQRLPAVLSRLYEANSEAKGELHMEQFTEEHQTISFVPDE